MYRQRDPGRGSACPASGPARGVHGPENWQPVSGQGAYGRTAPSRFCAYQSLFTGIFCTVRPVRGASMM
jgi:hypothetical protein